MRSDTRYREARSSLLASLFVVLAVFVIGKEPPSPLLPSGEKKHSDPSRYIYLSFVTVSIVENVRALTTSILQYS